MLILLPIVICKYAFGLTNQNIKSFIKTLLNYNLDPNLLKDSTKILNHFKKIIFEKKVENEVDNFYEEIKTYRMYLQDKINIYSELIESNFKNLKKIFEQLINFPSYDYITLAFNFLNYYNRVTVLLKNNITICESNIRLLEYVTISHFKYNEIDSLRQSINENKFIDKENTNLINVRLLKLYTYFEKIQIYRNENKNLIAKIGKKLSDEISIFEIEFIEIYSDLNNKNLSFYLQTTDYKK